jgi:hypothetical protein
MKDLVFFFIHYNNIQVHGIEYFTQIRNKQTWPVLEAAWLCRPSEVTHSLKVAATKILAIRRFSRAPKKTMSSSESQQDVDDPDDEQAEQTEPQVYYFGG